MNIKKVVILLTSLTTLCFGIFSQSQIKDTKHNLSVSGPGKYKSLDETRICKFCHTPHSAKPKQPLWNHQLSAVMYYKMYRSPTFEASNTGEAPITIDGDSRLCLSCHDGTVALGAMVRSKSKAKFKEGLGMLPPSAKGFIGTDLSGSHPISFVVTEALIARNNIKDTLLNNLIQMKSDPDVRLDADNKMQCTSCHDAHSDKNFATSGIHFWAKPTFNEVCLICHRL
jgi:hypothetical protein